MNHNRVLKLGCVVALLSVTMATQSGATSATSLAAGGSLDSAAERYRPALAAAVEQSLTGAQTLRERIVAKDLEGAKKAWIASRVGWERSEVFTSGFTSELDAAIDAWPSAVTGFHFIEARLFGAHEMDVLPATDALIFHLANLKMMVRGTPLTGQGMLEGTAKLAYEIGDRKFRVSPDRAIAREERSDGAWPLVDSEYVLTRARRSPTPESRAWVQRLVASLKPPMT